MNSQSNLKQMGLATMQYVQDYDERLPLTIVSHPNTATPPGGVNVAYADGHVKWLRSDKVVQEARTFHNTNHTRSAWDPLADNN